MSYLWLKRIRVIVGLFFLISFTLLFIDFRGIIPEKFMQHVTFLQFIPSFLKFFALPGFAAIGFLIVLLLTFLFGRVYCSAICPLGILQDVINFLSLRSRPKKKRRFAYKRPLNWLRYPLLVLVVISFLFGSIFLINWLDPYSTFGRISTYYFKPLVVGANNGLASMLESFDLYILFPYHMVPLQWGLYIFPTFMLGLIVYLSLKRGRLYCNTVCPVGNLLGLVSRFSLFKIRMDDSKCTNCGLCERACKAECIDFKERSIDMSRCVSCFNCLTKCSFDAIHMQYTGFSSVSYKKPAPQVLQSSKPSVSSGAEVDTDKRRFIASSLTYLFGLAGVSMAAAQSDTLTQENTKGLQKIIRKTPVSPPGSGSVERFTSACTACTLCVSACPTGVLQPSFLEYGLLGIMQPYMDFITGYCNYDCVKCGEVCPTGAINPMEVKTKQTEQLGIARFVKSNCIVYTEGSDCGACSEHCPTKAVHMIPYQNGLVIPEVRDEICIGCGACEYACPVAPPHKAIYVEGNAVHQKAEEPKREKLKQEEEGDEEFPF